MKKQLFCLLALVILAFCGVQAQGYKKVRKVVSVIGKEIFYLNGGTRATFGGKSRNSVMFTLPANTVEWYYEFSTTPNEGTSQNLGLFAKLTRLVDPTGLTELAVSELSAPTGSGVCDVYLLDKANRDAFLNKVDNFGGTFYAVPEGRKENYKQASVKVKSIRFGTWFLGFKNPSATTGVSVTLEISAVVEELVKNEPTATNNTPTNSTTTQPQNNSVWSQEAKNVIYAHIYQHLVSQKYPDGLASKIATCTTEKAISEKTASEFDATPQTQRDYWLNEILMSCNEKFNPKPTEEQEKARTYLSLGWKSYEKGNIENAIEYTKKAIEIDKTSATFSMAKNNLGLFYLIKGDNITATDCYVEAITGAKKLPVESAKYQLQAFKKDLEEALTKYPTIKDYEIILEQIQSELKKYE